MKNKEVDEILEIYQNNENSAHLSSCLGIHRYIKMADQIKKILGAGKLLDWGAGYGQMSYLLKNRGFNVVSYEITPHDRPLLEKVDQPTIMGTDPVKLPFPDASFDAVLSSGVLEHVQDDKASIREIARILKTNGYFIVFMLPNKYSYIEYISDRLGRGDHPIKYSVSEIHRLLKEKGFAPVAFAYQNFLPYNLKGFPKIVQRAYHKLDRLVEMLDLVLTQLPLIRNISTNLMIIAQKERTIS